jgi:hypothetical protein
LGHIVEVVAKSDDVSTNAISKMVDALSAEDATI